MRLLKPEIPDFPALTTRKRRTFLPNKVNIIYQCMGRS